MKSSPPSTASPSLMAKEKLSPISLPETVLVGSVSRRATSTRAVEAPSSKPPACRIRSSTVVFSENGNVPGLATSPLMVSVPRFDSS